MRSSEGGYGFTLLSRTFFRLSTGVWSTTLRPPLLQGEAAGAVSPNQVQDLVQLGTRKLARMARSGPSLA